MNLTPDFTENIARAFPSGPQWLNDLPALHADLCRRWHLTPAPDTFQLSFNYVAPVTRADGTEAVLKIGVPHPELFAEIAALGHYNGHGMTRLLDADTEHGALLLERLRPGTMLSDLFDPNDPNGGRDDEATQIIAQTMQALWLPVPAAPPLLTLDSWIAEMEPSAVRYPAMMETLRDEALAQYRELRNPDTHVLLHGDLHHYNILRDGDGWRAIDPKGIVGDPLFDVYACLKNPFSIQEHHNPQYVLHRRVAILADVLNADRDTICRWGFIGQVLSAWWSVDENAPNGGDHWQSAAHLAEILRST